MFSNFSQQIPGLQPGIYGNAWSGHELGPQGATQQAPAWGGLINPFAYNPPVQPPFNLGPAALNPHLQSQSGANSALHNPIHMVPVLGQLAQQLAIQSAVTQQVAQHISLVVQQLAQQLAVQGMQAQYYGQNPFAASAQTGYSGFNPQAQSWGANRQPTIQ
jgi:hypothetical protein